MYIEHGVSLVKKKKKKKRLTAILGLPLFPLSTLQVAETRKCGCVQVVALKWWGPSLSTPGRVTPHASCAPAALPPYKSFYDPIWGWVDGFAFGVVRILIEFARIRSVCESVQIANQFAGEAVYSRAICTILRSIANPGRIRANPFSLRIVANCESV